jgi:hypothetical protein
LVFQHHKDTIIFWIDQIEVINISKYL